MPEEITRCEKCGDTGVSEKFEESFQGVSRTVEVPCNCKAGEEFSGKQGFGIEAIFAWSAFIGTALGFAGYFLPLLILQVWTGILLFAGVSFVVAMAIDKPQTFWHVLVVITLFELVLVGPMWLVYQFLR